MPQIFDNIELVLMPTLKSTIKLSYRADFCVGYFNLRGWKHLQDEIEAWPGGEGNCVRLLIGMQRPPEDSLRELVSLTPDKQMIDLQTASRLKKQLAEDLRTQLTFGAPNNSDEIALRRLAEQLRTKKVIARLYLRHPLHAKLYLLYRDDPINPIVAYLGSSNLTFSGLSNQGELNVDVLDIDAGSKLSRWFEDRWNDNFCVDISKELVQIIDESWAREDPLPPYHIYLKMAYHLSQEARTGVSEFRIPGDLKNILFDFQAAAVKIAAHHIHKRGGVLVGDVVGLGKTLVGTAISRIFDEDLGYDTLIICPKNLAKMWQSYCDQYRLRAKVLSISKVLNELPDLRRYRLVIIDESHNLRNREGRRYKAIQEYIQKNESKVVLLTATPYNKTYLDLSSQLRLFLPDDQKLSVRPEKLLREMGLIEFIRLHQADTRSIAAFEKSAFAEDWQELMRLYMVRRTRSFIKSNYAETDLENGRKFLSFPDGRRSYFPNRTPRRVSFPIDDQDPNDQYARLYAEDVVDTINQLNLPRYGLGNYVKNTLPLAPTPAEKKILANLSQAGRRLMGFSRTNLFKRLESSGYAFQLSIERHILRNYVFLYALQNNLSLPIGTQDSSLLDSRFSDADKDADLGDVYDPLVEVDEEEPETEPLVDHISRLLRSEAAFQQRAAEVYKLYTTQFRKRFDWVRPGFFQQELAEHLAEDAYALLEVLRCCGDWDPLRDAKLHALRMLLTVEYPQQKVIVFTQFADTVHYLEEQLQEIPALMGVTGDSEDPTGLAWRFSPMSNDKRQEITPENELRVLIATDVLSEGQNLQDCAVVVNYDLPWAIIRLIQRAGRVDRIGQQADQIFCHTFLPAEGVERIIRLRDRVRQRLKENAEVVGTDEVFFEDDTDNQAILNLYNEKAGILDGDEDETEIDLSSYAFQIWKNATEANPALKKTIPDLPDVSFSARAYLPTPEEPCGALVYLRTGEGNDALAWIDPAGESVTESQFTILRAAACPPDTPALPRSPEHHELVVQGIQHIAQVESTIGGQLGRPSGARFRTYERLKNYATQVRGMLWDTQELHRAIDQIYQHPLRQSAVDTLNRQLRSGIADEDLASLVVSLYNEDRLCLVSEAPQTIEPRIICSLGLQE
ncbi:MAG: hypothetical protein JW963_11570 [Anaerolineales bacterium]|nr:hypothetical protein [Anaerolineales bacterium]